VAVNQTRLGRIDVLPGDAAYDEAPTVARLQKANGGRAFQIGRKRSETRISKSEPLIVKVKSKQNPPFLV
jgi:hypothetical protein